jgi:glycosyltransferase involved in cell wall biosynthesis
MRLVSIAPFNIIPPDSGGQALVYGASREYGRRLTSFRCLTLVPITARPVRRVPPFPYRATRTAASLLIVFDRLGWLPKVPYLWSQRGYAAWLAREAMRSNPDVVEVNCPWVASVRRHLPARVKVVMLAHNVEAIWYADALARRLAPGFFRRWLARIEQEAMDLADHVVCLTEQDRQELVRRYGCGLGKMSVVPPGFDPGLRAARGRRAESGPRVRGVFVGSGFSDNVAAARRILEDLAPRCDGQADLVIAGRVYGALAGLPVPPNVRLVGYKPDLAPLYRESSVSLNPVAMRTGINMKVVEALAAGLRVIATPDGARGYEDLVGGPIQVGTLAEFPALIRAAQPLSAAELERVEAYAWPRIIDRRLALYRRLAGLPETPP